MPEIVRDGNYFVVMVGELTLYFSYKTLIAFQDHSQRMTCVRENDWGATTGRHLNRVNESTGTARNVRLNAEQFETQWLAVKERHSL